VGVAGGRFGRVWPASRGGRLGRGGRGGGWVLWVRRGVSGRAPPGGVGGTPSEGSLLVQRPLRGWMGADKRPRSARWVSGERGGLSSLVGSV